MTDDELGSVSAFVTAMLLCFISCVGLAVDGGRLIAARIELADHAENAARIGVQHVESLRSGEPTVDVQSAEFAASRYLSDQGVTGQVSASREVVEVHVSQVVTFTLLFLVGLQSREISISRSAMPVPGP